MRKAREICLTRRPNGQPTVDDFALVERDIPDVASGEIEVQNLLMSVDPYIRLRLDEAQELGTPVLGSGLGRVTQSRNPKFKEGDLVRHFGGFRDAFISNGQGLIPVQPDPTLPLTAQLHALGGIGLCAYNGLIGVAKLQEGEQVFVSSAAGAVGSIAVQIAKIKNCYVVGSTGSEEKAEWLRREFHLDAVINYRAQPIREALAAVTPKGLDVYFENVGGDHFEAALARMNVYGRIPVCGMISGYNIGGSPVVLTENLITKRVLIKGFGFTDCPELADQFRSDMTGWLKDGRVKFYETVIDGFEKAPEAFIGLFTGLNTGKMLVRVAN